MEPKQHTSVATVIDGVSKINNENQQNVDKMPSKIPRNKLVTLAIICYINLVNFIDRYTLPGIFFL